MPMIAQDEILKIRNSASIVDIISAYIPLTPKGKNYFGVCPFHEDHSPSMSVSSEKQIYKCFSCGATGNVFTFIENYLNVSFSEAVSIVANTLGISIKTNIYHEKEAKYQKEYDLYELVLKLYQNNLNSENGLIAKEYLQKRGLDEKVIDEFSLGLSFQKNVLYTILQQKNYPSDLIMKLGLANSTSDGGVIDTFQSRVIFPIHNLEGKVVGFTARALREDIKPKYINSKETYIFKKGNTLFNYHRAKDIARLEKKLVVVEGNMDAIRLYSNGLKNVVALMGTSLTKEQTEVLKKLKAKIILMLDNDEAGESATYAIGQILEKNNIPLEIVRLSDVKDPDEYVLKYGIEAILDNIKNAMSFMDFKLSYLKKNKDLKDTNGLTTYLKEVIHSLEGSNDEILKEVTLQKLSNDYNISYAVLKSQLKESQVVETPIIPIKEEKKGKKDSLTTLANAILYFMMHSLDYIKIYQSQLGLFPNLNERLVANEILYFANTHHMINLADFMVYAETTELKEQIFKIIEENNLENLTDEALMELIDSYKAKLKRQKELEIKAELKKELDENKKMNLLKELTELKKGSVEDESN